MGNDEAIGDIVLLILLVEERKTEEQEGKGRGEEIVQLGHG